MSYDSLHWSDTGRAKKYFYAGGFFLLLSFSQFTSFAAVSLISDTRNISIAREEPKEATFGEDFVQMFEEDFISHSSDNVLAHEIATQSSRIEGGSFIGNGGGWIEYPDGKAGTGALCESDLTWQIKLTTPTHFTFNASCAGGRAADYVKFYGATTLAACSVQGETSTEGLLKPGTYTIEAHLHTQADPNWTVASWHFELDCSDPEKDEIYTASQKQALQHNRNSLAVYGGVAAVLGASIPFGLNGGEAGAALGPVGAGVGAGLAYGGAVIVFSISLIDQSINDPPDQNYGSIAQPLFIPLPPLTNSSSLPVGLRIAMNEWLLKLEQIRATAQALYTTVNRAQGAYQAGNINALTAQKTAVAKYCGDISVYLQDEPALRAKFYSSLTNVAFPNFFVPSRDVIQIGVKIASGEGLPPAIQQDMLYLGADTETFERAKDLFFGMNVGASGYSFPQLLLDSSVNDSMLKAAAALAFFRPVVQNVTIRPPSKISCDFLTHPGSTYFVQSLSGQLSASNWVTIFSTNPSSSIVSFTNNIDPNGSSEFYRVGHN